MMRALFAILTIAALAITAQPVVPRGIEAVRLRAAAEDPARLSDLRLEGALDGERVAAEIDAALVDRDAELAVSFLALADERGIPVDPARRDRVTAASTPSALAEAEAFARGFAYGDTDSVTNLAGAVAGDVVGYGDLRDLAREGSRWLRDEPADETLIGLAAVGLVLTGVTWTSVGAALPARTGLTTLKAARRSGRLARPLAASLGRVTAGMVDRNALRAALASAARLDLTAARGTLRTALRPDAVARLARLGDDAAVLAGRTGQRGALQALSVAENVEDLSRAARLAAKRGPSARAILKVLGRGALVLGSLGASLIGWTFALLGWALALLAAVAAFARALGRVLFRRRRRDRRAGQGRSLRVTAAPTPGQAFPA